MPNKPPEYKQLADPLFFEGEWYIVMKVQGTEFTTGPFQTKEAAEEWYQANQTKQCPNCED